MFLKIKMTLHFKVLLKKLYLIVQFQNQMKMLKKVYKDQKQLLLKLLNRYHKNKIMKKLITN